RPGGGGGGGGGAGHRHRVRAGAPRAEVGDDPQAAGAGEEGGDGGRRGERRPGPADLGRRDRHRRGDGRGGGGGGRGAGAERPAGRGAGHRAQPRHLPQDGAEPLVGHRLQRGGHPPGRRGDAAVGRRAAPGGRGDPDVAQH